MEIEENKALRILSMLYMLMKRKGWLIENLAYYLEADCAEDRKFAEFQLHTLNQMIELVLDDNLPLFIKEYLLKEDIRHFNCGSCGKHFTPTQAYILLASNGQRWISRWSGDSVYGYEFACC